jgi:hypothetical protein
MADSLPLVYGAVGDPFSKNVLITIIVATSPAFQRPPDSRYWTTEGPAFGSVYYEPPQRTSTDTASTRWNIPHVLKLSAAN